MNDKFLKVAKQAALEAGDFIFNFFGKNIELILKKGDSSNLVTKADLGSEEIIVRLIKKNFPDHNIIAEEKGKTKGDSNFTWIIDPLDGTTSFASGIPNFAVSIGLLKDNKPFLGVINWVARQELYWAQKGKGAYLNNQKILVRKTKKIEDGVFGFSVGTTARREEKLKAYILPLFSKVRYPYILGSVAVDLSLISKGALDAAIGQGYAWDFAGGVIIVSEAGGKVTDLEGDEPDWTQERFSIVASNGLIHDQILEALK
ncbi:inositol monophosphatase [Candidatus Daviesbacteria bacterium]|nr:inositol monophosphatase [Candidatus Daviesbacteria bacterium]MBI3109415.1 inositol monophosphatase [Candidatus Daviesbacteria bacterium]